MNGHDRQTRIYIDWSRLRPTTLRGWLSVLASIVMAVCLLVLVAAIASTLLVIAAVAAAVSGVWWMLQRLVRGRSHPLIPSRYDHDA